MGYHESVFTRSELNPILTADDLPFEANVVFNPGAARLRDGRVGLLVRVEDRYGREGTANP